MASLVHTVKPNTLYSTRSIRSPVKPNTLDSTNVRSPVKEEGARRFPLTGFPFRGDVLYTKS